MCNTLQKFERKKNVDRCLIVQDVCTSLLSFHSIFIKVLFDMISSMIALHNNQLRLKYLNVFVLKYYCCYYLPNVQKRFLHIIRIK
jgi:hypothetical protein